jgi:hypothetical protein
MNYSTAVMLFNPQIRSVSVSYEVDKDGKGVQPFTIFKTMDPSIKREDRVVVPTSTRHSFTVCRVEEVDPEVDFESGTQLNWVVGKVDLHAYEAIIFEEGKMIDTMKAAEKQAKREEIKSKVQEFYKGQDLAKLAMISPSKETTV